MKFKDYIEESNQFVYHGQNYPGDPFKHMDKRIHEGNQQEGPGIYFGAYNVAKDYGKFITKTKDRIQNKDFVKSRAELSKTKLYNRLPKFLYELFKIDPEPIYYEITNWIEIYEPEDIKDYHFDILAKKLKYEETRNFLITYAKLYKKDFLDVFNKVYPNIKGTYNPDLNFYAFLKSVKLEKVEKVEKT